MESPNLHPVIERSANPQPLYPYPVVFPRSPPAAPLRMLEENPRLLCLVERSVMKHLALELTNLPV